MTISIHGLNAGLLPKRVGNKYVFWGLNLGLDLKPTKTDCVRLAYLQLRGRGTKFVQVGRTLCKWRCNPTPTAWTHGPAQTPRVPAFFPGFDEFSPPSTSIYFLKPTTHNAKTSPHDEPFSSVLDALEWRNDFQQICGPSPLYIQLWLALSSHKSLPDFFCFFLRVTLPWQSHLFII